MGTSLTGLTPATTYDALIKVGDNGPITASLKTLSDGLGNNLPMEASASTINFTGTLQQSGTAVPTAAQVNAKQDTLVSGTNIKTINGTSVLGSGDIVTPYTPPSGVAGAIQFSNGSAFASDAANFFWDDTNNRLGIGTNAPSATADFKGSGTTSATSSLIVENSAGTIALEVLDDSRVKLGNSADFTVYSGSAVVARHAMNIGSTSLPTAQLQVKGSGSTSATTSLLVQNSSGTNILSINDGGGFSTTTSNFSSVISNDANSFQVTGGIASIRVGATITTQASAILQADSTTQGFLPPRMTTTQKNNISSPAAGLVVYDSTTNKLCCYNGSTWNDLF